MLALVLRPERKAQRLSKVRSEPFSAAQNSLERVKTVRHCSELLYTAVSAEQFRAAQNSLERVRAAGPMA
jgi:hypothetical protein